MSSTVSSAPVTVVVPTYRSGGSLRYALESIRNQSYQDFEVIVTADGDPEDSAGLVARMGDPRFRYISSAENSGTQATPNHRAVNEARGEWIAYLGHDDIWMPWHLDTLIATAKRDHADFVHALVLAVRPGGGVDVLGPRSTSANVFRSAWFVPPSGWLHRKDLLARAGGWRENAKAIDNVDKNLLDRIIASGAAIACSGEASVIKFVSGDYSAYGPAAVRPQASYFSRVSSNAHSLERELLLRAAEDYARLKYSGHPRPAPATRTLLRSLGYAVKQLTRDMPVLGWFWRRRYTALWHEARKRRGLAAKR